MYSFDISTSWTLFLVGLEWIMTVLIRVIHKIKVKSCTAPRTFKACAGDEHSDPIEWNRLLVTKFQKVCISILLSFPFVKLMAENNIDCRHPICQSSSIQYVKGIFSISVDPRKARSPLFLELLWPRNYIQDWTGRSILLTWAINSTTTSDWRLHHMFDCYFSFGE